jgi:hypothetical protein
VSGFFYLATYQTRLRAGFFKLAHLPTSDSNFAATFLEFFMLVANAPTPGTATFTLPVNWASYLVNNDSSFFRLQKDGGAAEMKIINNWKAIEGLGNCLDYSLASFFTWHPEGPQELALGNDCLEFTFALKH